VVTLRKVRAAIGSKIAAGDFVWLDDGVVRPASEFPWFRTLGDTQAGFAAKFLGIAHQSLMGTEVDTLISVDISSTGVYEVDVLACEYEFGQPLGLSPSPVLGSDVFEVEIRKLSSQVFQAALADNSIARVSESVSGVVHSVRITFASAYNTSSSNSHARLGRLRGL
jgi:hypothetical protein